MYREYEKQAIKSVGDSLPDNQIGGKTNEVLIPTYVNMAVRVLHYSDIENAYDDPEQIGRLAGRIEQLGDEETIVVGTGDNLAVGALSTVTEKGRG